jgi:hypothetical protein
MNYPYFRLEFPEVPEGENVAINATKLLDKEETENLLDDMINNDLELVEDGNLAGKGFLLPDGYDWVLGKDSNGNVILLPLETELS